MEFNHLYYNGSLLENSRYIVSPYDLQSNNLEKKVKELKSIKIHNLSQKQYFIDYTETNFVNIINGMGVTLGDSIIGICVLDIIKKINNNIKIRVIRPETCKKYVNDIYNLASNIVDEISYMPFDLNCIKNNEFSIDIGNQVYWHDFNCMEMHDFFIKSLGINDSIVKDSWKTNSWLENSITSMGLKKANYALFSPYSSTSLRSIPKKHHKKIIRKLQKELGIDIFGFSDVKLDGYRNVSFESKSTLDFIKLISESKFLYTCDSSALHIAAGFNIPTFCIFTSIKPKYRSLYYKNCNSVYIGNNETEGLHETDDIKILSTVNKLYEDYYASY